MLAAILALVAAAQLPQIPFEKYQLENGLTVILVQHPTGQPLCSPHVAHLSRLRRTRDEVVSPVAASTLIPVPALAAGASLSAGAGVEPEQAESNIAAIKIGFMKSEYEGHCFSASLAANSSSSLMIEFWQRTPKPIAQS